MNNLEDNDTLTQRIIGCAIEVHRHRLLSPFVLSTPSESPTDFIEGIVTMAGNGDPHAQSGAAAHLYVANRSMSRRAFYNADGEMLVVPQQGRQRFVTELGVIEVEPHEIVVIPRGVRFRMELLDDVARGYICENYGANFRLPDLGPIGSNGLANPRDFLTPVAAYEDVDGPHELVAKFMGNLPPRILAMQDTFRPPWFHRNIASEFMGLVHGAYDAKAEGFVPGGASLHNSMSGHGPDAETFEKASRADLSKPDVIRDTMAFMFETRCVLRPTKHAIESAELQQEYYRCWEGLEKHFDPRKP